MPVYDVVLFVLSSTLTIQKLPEAVAVSTGIPSSGHAGLRIGASEAVTSVPYKTETDGRISFGRIAWRKFLDGKHLEERQTVLISLRSTHHRQLDVMIVMQMV